jgi:hypothetical protein
VIAVKRLRALSHLSVVLGLVCLSCGGTGSDADRKAAQAAKAAAPSQAMQIEKDDPGSLPTYDCNADKPIEGITLHMIEDWETVAGSGWYTNNDRCEPCQKATDAITAAHWTDYSSGGPEIEIDAGALSVALKERDDCDKDGVCFLSQLPSYFAKPVPGEVIPGGGRCGSTSAFHVISGPFSTWGGQLGMNIFPPHCVTADCPCDPATGANCAELRESVRVPGGPYDGIAFWARVAPGSGQTMLVQPKESHTDIKYPYAENGQPPCIDNVGKVSADDTTSGCDAFGSFAILNNDWQFFALPFEEMRQAGWGKKAPFFDLQNISNLTFFYGQGTWDIWIDDIAYYKRSAQ